MPKRKSNGRPRGLDQTFVKALAHELRVDILTILTERVASPNELAKELGEGLSQVSYHVNVLKDCDRIELVKTEPRRGAVEHSYRATSKTLLPAKAWRKIKGALRTVVGGGLASDLFDDLAEAMSAHKLTKEDSHISRVVGSFDAEGRRKVKAIGERATKEVEDEQRASSARAAKAQSSTVALRQYSFGVLAFEKDQDPSGKPQQNGVAKSASRNRKPRTVKSQSGRTEKSRNGSKQKAKAGAN
jgi:DNA-binding transcriptional ArsR family regulator